MIKLDHEEVWYWYTQLEKFFQQRFSRKKFCDQNNLDYKKFCNMNYLISYKSRSDQELYKKLIPLARKYMSSDVPFEVFLKENKVGKWHLKGMVTHLNYLDLIEELKQKRAQPSMDFIQVPNTFPSIVQESEVIEPRNSIELIISKGIKVTVEHEVGSEKLIKIIEFLRDL